MNWFKRNRTTIIITLIGGGLGFLYWDIWGCQDGCMIRSNPYLMILYGLFFGYFIGDIIQKRTSKDNQQTENENEKA